MNILDKINSPEDLKALPQNELPGLCAEIRAFLIQNISGTGGHLSSNLGVVELTVALHRVYDPGADRLVFDVGHQSYIHKLLTGRRDAFPTLRSLGGLSGFPKPCESAADAFVAGHASTSISVALGMARARTLSGARYDVAALIGDGALTGGLAYEGLSDAGQSGEPLVVILNDNGMSINRNVGGMARLLTRQRIKPGYLDFKRSYRRVMGKLPPLYDALHGLKEWIKSKLLPGNMFDDLGFYYIGPVDGHDLPQLERVIRWARDLREPVLLHVITQKGRGYAPAEAEPELYHGVDCFDAERGVVPCEKPCFSAVFGNKLTELAERNGDIVAVTAAMADGTGLVPFRKRFPKRFFDVGIAEGHAVSMAAGMAKQGKIPVFAVYSSFLQRGYDMLIHDLSLLKLHAVLAVDRAGIVGGDGETHTGAFDAAYLSSVPHMTVLCPSSFAELRSMLEAAVLTLRGPVALRYPRGGEERYTGDSSGEALAVLKTGGDGVLVSYGIMINRALEAAELLAGKGIDVSVVKINRLNPLDTEGLLPLVRGARCLVVLEDVCAAGCLGRRLLAEAALCGFAPERAALLNLGSGIVPHGNTEPLLEKLGLDGKSVAARVEALLERGAPE